MGFEVRLYITRFLGSLVRTGPVALVGRLGRSPGPD